MSRYITPFIKFRYIFQILTCFEGGSTQTIFEDVPQAVLMWKLRVKIDSWSQGVDESIRHRNRLILVDLYLRLPPRRVWLYVKQVRTAELEQLEELGTLIGLENSTQEPEDIIAQGKCTLSTTM